MDKHRVGIGGPVGVSPVKGMTNGTAMIGAVVNQVKDRFLTAQHALLAIHENKANRLLKLRRFKAFKVLSLVGWTTLYPSTNFRVQWWMKRASSTLLALARPSERSERFEPLVKFRRGVWIAHLLLVRHTQHPSLYCA